MLTIITKITIGPVTSTITIIIQDGRIITTILTDPRTKAEITHRSSTVGLTMFKPIMNQVGGDTTHGAIVSTETGGMQEADDGEAIVSRATAATMTTGPK